VTQCSYAGTELKIFSRALNWKRYWAGRVRPYVRGAVLEVGAGTGVNTPFLKDRSTSSWLCLEPDPALAAELDSRCRSIGCEVHVGTLHDVPEAFRFDTIIYIDVLEHIENDRAELLRAAGFLRAGGHLVVLAPAHQWLFSPFDAAIGHYRRYTRRTLAQAAPPELMLIRLDYLDAVGMLLSLGNRAGLRQRMPGRAQVWLWDRIAVPISRLLDRMLRYRAGKSVLAVWRRE
jgi:SAM-dependent methyltransferase